ncbi:hypothetical protein ACPC58_09765 [Streptococcus sp. VTCC 12905]|uniref:hypothetical protein n=1 Tax=Streptococcus sp. VTCC 12905 TaxID=3413768 RepID=UPI003D9C6FD5
MLLRMAVTVMFRITNLQTRQQETCANRDELLSVINEKSVWAEDRNEIFTLQLEQLSEDGEILDNTSLSLPLQSIVEEALDGFGLKREKKGFAFLQRHKTQPKVSASEDVSEEEPAQSAELDLSEPISAPLEAEELTEAPEKELKSNPHRLELEKTQEQLVETAEKPSSKTQKVSAPKGKKKATPSKVPRQAKARPASIGLIWKVLAIGALGLSIASFALLQQQTQTIKALENRVTLEEHQGQVEVVGRFFIANYYSGRDDNLKDFLSKDLKAEGVSAKTDEQVQSTIYEGVSQKNDTINVTFVVTTKDDDDTIKTVRLTLPFQESETATYGYVLVGQPKFSSFGE